MKTAIDLGYTYGDKGSYPEPVTLDKDTKHYPCLHIECGDALLENLPDDGTITLRFHVSSRSTNEREGKKTCSLILEAKEILEVEKSAPKPKKEQSAEEALDALAGIESARED